MGLDDVSAPSLELAALWGGPPVWVLCLATVAAVYALWLLSRLSMYLALNKIPNQLPSSPLGGNLSAMTGLPKVRYAGKPDTQSLFSKQADQCLASGHGMFRFAFFRYIPFLSREWVIIADPKLVKEMLAQDNYGKFQKGKMYKLARPLIGSGILAQPDGPEWKSTRRMANPGFHPRMLRLAVAVAVETTTAMCARWDRSRLPTPAGTVGHQANVLDEMLRLTIDVLGRTAFSYDFKSVTHVDSADSVLFSSFDTILKSLAEAGRASNLIERVQTKFLPKMCISQRILDKDRKLKQAMSQLDGQVEEIILKRRSAESEVAADSSQDAELPQDLLDFFLKSEHGTAHAAEAKTQLDRQVIVDNIKTFLFAGHDTTASALSWALYLLSESPETEKRLLEECREFGLVDAATAAKQLSYELLVKMPYLAAVVKETLRLYPSAGFTRQVEKGAKFATVGQYTIPEGVEIFVFPQLMQRDERNWGPDAKEFKPERWLSIKESDTNAYLPFSMGPRNCVGMNLARVEIYTVLVMLLLRYKFEYIPEVKDEKPQIVVYLSITPNRMLMQATPR